MNAINTNVKKSTLVIFLKPRPFSNINDT
jgi:hypothetical protein